MSKNRALKRAASIVRSYKNVFDSDDGRVVLHDLMRTCFFKQSTYNPKFGHNEIYYNEGARSVVLQILQYLKKDEQQLLEMIEQGEKQDGSYEYPSNYE